MDPMTLELEKPTTVRQPSKKSTVTLGGKNKSTKGRRWKLWGAIASVVILILILWGWHHHQTAVAAALTPVETATVVRTTIEKSVESAGTVASNLDVNIKCRASGPVAHLMVDISQQVKEGQLLCQLDPTDEQLAVSVSERTCTQSETKLAQANLAYKQAELNLKTSRLRDEAALESAKVKAANLQAKAERQKQLKEQNLGSEEDFETAQTDAASAKADAQAAQETVDELQQQDLQLQNKKLDIDNASQQLESDKFNLNQQKQQLAYTNVTSPMDGTISSLDVHIGSMVQSGTGGFSGGTDVMTVSDLSRMYVAAAVDQSDIGGVQLGQSARVVVDSFPDRQFLGHVVLIAVQGSNSSNVVSFGVKVEVTDKNKNLLRPAMTGTVTIVEDERKNVLAIPTSAVLHKNGRTYVQIAGGEQRMVTLGMEGAENIEVLSGLNEGEKVLQEQSELPTRWKAGDGGPPPPK